MTPNLKSNTKMFPNCVCRLRFSFLTSASLTSFYIFVHLLFSSRYTIFASSTLINPIASTAATTTTTSVVSAAAVPNSVKATCGFPGSPKNGRVLHLLETYEEGMVITFECDSGFFLLGSITRTCQPNGTWSNDIPICDQSVKILGLTAASEALNNYPPQLAVDGNYRTCFFGNRRKPRWWRVELPKQSMANQSIISVALTLPPIHADLHFSIYVIETPNSNLTDPSAENDGTTVSKYHKCATFRGVFSSKTILVQCAKGAGGLRGNYLQIEDDHPQLEYFGLCEVDIFVEHEAYECGEPEIPANGFLLAKDDTGDGNKSSKQIEYYCHDGYRLVGGSSRRCDHSTGQWIEREPFCERITCAEPSPVTNGHYRLFNDYHDMPVVGTKIVYECNPGFLLTGPNDTRRCDATGDWLGAKPHCEAVDCGHPESLLLNVDDFMTSGAQFRLLNGSTKYSAYAELICPPSAAVVSETIPAITTTIATTTTTARHGRSNQNKSNLLFRCREDSIWTEVIVPVESEELTGSATAAGAESNGTSTRTASCVRQRHNGFLYFFGNGHKLRKSYYRDNSLNMLHFLAAVVLLAFFSIVIIVILLFKRDIVECPENFCSPFNDRAKAIGESIVNLFAQMNASIRSFFAEKLCQRNGGGKCGGEQAEQPSFSIVPSSTTVPEIEIARREHDKSTITIPESVTVVANSTPSEITKDSVDLNSALATFYEEITNAAKQVFAEDTDRKLLRAARIAAELDVIKSQQQNKQHESNYHWIYATPPRPQHFSSSLPPSLTPSMHDDESMLQHHHTHTNHPHSSHHHSIPSSGQIYAKVDLIRKHRYRKERDTSTVYQVPPRPRHMEIDPNSSLISYTNNGSTVYQLRKAISSPDTVFIEGDYTTIRRLRLPELAGQHNRKSDYVPGGNETIQAQQINSIPIQTLL